MSNDIQVTEKMAAFINWALDKGQDEVKRLVREHLAMVKEECLRTSKRYTSDGEKWDDALEPNDGVDQWKHGGDCNLCRRAEYCKKKCRANRLLKEITTPFLYRLYVEEHPEVAAADASKNIAPEDVLKGLGLQ